MSLAQAETRQQRRAALAQFEDELVAEGYLPKEPPRRAIFHYDNIDAEACRDSACPNCGHRGLAYRPWTKPGSYRAIAYCAECGAFDEF